MTPQEQLCPKCGAKGKDGFIGIHSQKEKRYRCQMCGRTFSETTATPFYGLKRSHEDFERVLALLAHGCPVQAIVVAFEIDERTIWSWIRKAGKHCHRVHEAEIEQGQLDLGHIQADELKINTFLGIVWLGMVIMVQTRLWLGGCLEPARGKKLLRQMLKRASRAGRGGDLLVSVDGFNVYPVIIPEVFTQTWNWVQARWQGWTQVGIVVTMKQKGNKRGAIHQEIRQGKPAFIRRLIRQSQGLGWINTAYIERLNATFRARISSLARRGRALVRRPEHLEAWMWVVGCVYNWCTYHDSLKIACPVSPHKRRWLKRTPAIAAGLTDHRWSISELLWWKYPTSRVLYNRILRAEA